MEEKRLEIICPVCGKEMQFTKKITPPSTEGLGGLIYRCPTRENESGCGYVKEVLVIFGDKGQVVFD